MRRPSLTAAVLLAVVAMLPTACAKQNAHAVAAAGPDGTQSVEIDVVNGAFRPWVIQAQLGQPLVIRLRNKGFTSHTFTVYDRLIDVVLAPGERRTATIQPPTRPDSWRFLCRFHDAGGMHGGLSFGDPGPERLAPP